MWLKLLHFVGLTNLTDEEVDKYEFIKFSKKIHKYSDDNRNSLLKSKSAGCFYCCRIFNTTEIVEWIDNSQTALCPHCRIDSVLPSKKVKFSHESLTKMSKYWFG